MKSMSRDQPHLLDSSYISISRHEMCLCAFHYIDSETYHHGILHLMHVCRTSGHVHPEGLSGASQELQHVRCTSVFLEGVRASACCPTAHKCDSSATPAKLKDAWKFLIPPHSTCIVVTAGIYAR